MADKRASLEGVVSELRDGMTIGIGGWGSRRKPMALVRAIARSSLRDLRIISYAGPDVGVLCATGQAREVVYGFASLDSIPLEPHFRRARQAGTIEPVEIDEGMLQWGLYAAKLRLPFLPTRAGLGSDVLRINPWLRTVTSPYTDAEELVAMKALPLDAALIHVHRADARGNCAIDGPDPFFDDLFAGAAARTYVSCERIVPTAELGPAHTLALPRIFTHAVVCAPGGAHFTSCPPAYGRDEAFQRTYADSAKDPDAWADFRRRYIDVSEAEYRRAAALERRR